MGSVNEEEPEVEIVVVSMTFMGRKTELSKKFTNEFMLTSPILFQRDVRQIFDDVYADFYKNDTR